MSSSISAEVRRSVMDRAEEACEYCLIHARDTFIGCEVDHVISEKHGGLTIPENLACACFYCNRHKGSDIASLDPQTGEAVRLFNPRIDIWGEHFQLEGDRINPKTSIGDVTARILKFNLSERLIERRVLIGEGKYPGRKAE